MSDKLVVSGSAVIEAKVKKDVIDSISYIHSFFNKINSMITKQRKDLHGAAHRLMTTGKQAEATPEGESRFDTQKNLINKTVYELDDMYRKNNDVLLALDEIESLIEQEETKEAPKPKKEEE